MSSSPIVKVTIQNTIISATSNAIAQVLAAYSTDGPISLQWTTICQFVLFSLVTAPLNYLWQEQMESLFPSTHLVPTDSAIIAASKDPSALDEKPNKDPNQSVALSPSPLTKPVFSIRNTIIKVIQEQTISAAWNTLAFSFFFSFIKSASASNGLSVLSSSEKCATAWQIARQDFWGIMKAGWKMWPLVSVINLVFIQDLQIRALIGSLAGLVWNIYLSLLNTGR